MYTTFEIFVFCLSFMCLAVDSMFASYQVLVLKDLNTASETFVRCLSQTYGVCDHRQPIHISAILRRLISFPLLLTDVRL